jgi:predicted transcriptional regulator
VEELGNPEPVSVRYRRSVTTVSPDDTLAEVLRLVFEHGFSQFPVLQEGKFRGLITGNEIVRWLGRCTQAASTQVDLAGVCVRTVLKEKDPFLKGVSIFCFARLDSPVTEVMGRFSIQQMLEVVLVTASGDKNSPIEGIVTQWDAARYPQ